MKIVCPSCAASYDVPDAVALSKRTVRCARCGGDWVPSVSESADVPLPAPPASAPAPAPAPAAPSPAPPAAEAKVTHANPAVPEPPAPPPAMAPSIVPAHEPAAAAMAQPAPEPVPEPPAPRQMPRQSAASAIPPAAPATAPHAGTREPLGAWMISLIILVSMIGAALAFQTKIIEIWPPSARVYAVLGLYHR